MFNISQFLNRIRGTQGKQILQRNIVRNVVLKNIGIDIPAENITIKSAVIFLNNISQSAKSAVYVKKQIILNEINKGQDTIIVRDIK